MFNFLEELVSEWYEYKGYLIKRNVKVGKSEKGGYEGEIDIVGYNPITKHLVHIETSMDADSWAKREKKIEKKFLVGKKYIHNIFEGIDTPKEFEQIAVLGSVNVKKHKFLNCGARIISVDQIFIEIINELKNKSILNNAVPEHFILIRCIQFVINHLNKIDKTLEKI